MDKPQIPLIMDNVLNTCWAILPSKLSEIMSVLQSKNDGLILEMAEQNKKSEPHDMNYTVKDGIAEIVINGTLSKRMGLIQALSGGTSYANIQSQIKKAEDDPDVGGLFYNISSPGGNVEGMFTTADVVFNAKKPSIAFANGLMASAAYILGSGADYVVASDRSAELFNLGVIAVHFDESKKYEKEGVKPTVFSAGKYKRSGNPYEPLSDKDTLHLQSKLDYMHTLAIDTVSKHRNMAADDLVNLGADVFIGEQAISAGIADEILTREQAMQKLHDVIDGRATFNRKAVVVKGQRTNLINTIERKNATMKIIKDFSLKAIAESITETTDLPELKAVEDACLLHFSEAEKTASNWIKEEEVKSMSRQVAALLDIRRRQILAQPKIEKAQKEYDLGRMIGRV
jgi:signal peptide peptidase SppA